MPTPTDDRRSQPDVDAQMIDQLKTSKRYKLTPPTSALVAAEPPAIRLVRSSKVEPTHAFAARLLNLAEVPGDRPLRDSHVNALIGHMFAGRFRYEQVNLAVARCVENNVEYRVNGQHTCWAVLYTPEEFGHEKVNLLSYECDTLDDVRALYATIDRGAVRTKRNVIAALLTDTEQFKDTPVRLMGSLMSGLAQWLWESVHERAKRTGDDLVALARDKHADIVERVREYAVQSGSFSASPFLDRSPVYAAMFDTFSVAPQRAAEFWSSVRDGTNMPLTTDPRLVLRNALSKARLMLSASAKTRQAGGRTTGQEEMFRWCIITWNAWRRGEEVKLLRVNLASKRPKAK